MQDVLLILRSFNAYLTRILHLTYKKSIQNLILNAFYVNN